MKALIKRAQVLGVIDQSSATRLYKQYSARRYTVQEPYALTPEPSTIITGAIRVHVTEHDYIEDGLAEAVLLTPDEFQADLMHKARRETNVVSLFGATANA
jgi:hypothetical protein